MNLILTTNCDTTANEVCERFYMAGKSFHRINLDQIPEEYSTLEYKQDDFLDIEKGLYFSIGVNHTNKNNSTYRYGKFKDRYDSIWFRRPHLLLSQTQTWESPTAGNSEVLKKAILKNKKTELEKIYVHILNEISCQCERQIGSLTKAQVNKLDVLQEAIKCGLSIPKTYIISDKATLKVVISQNPQGLITKSNDEAIHALDDSVGLVFVGYTVILDDNNLDTIPDEFSPSLVQEKIMKKFELRVFYLDSKCYSMAILSQSNPKTEVDFRDYDRNVPNRTLPFQLPVEVEDRIILLMNNLGLNSGSIDLLYSTDQSYVFLEVNPVGAIGMVSKPCHYNLEKEIFEFLTEDIKCNE